MSYLNDLDTYYINSISALHSIDYLISNEPSALQTQLEEAIAAKTGTRKDLSALIAAIKQPSDIYKNLTSTTIEEKTTSSSDNELELDLLKEDLMCIVCKGMDVGAKNRLLECSDCHSLYHQECHRPVVSSEENDSTWVCQNCKDMKRLKTSSPTFSRTSHSSSSSKESSSKSNYKSSSSSSSVQQSYKSSSYSSSKSSSYKSTDKNPVVSKSTSSNNGSRSSSSSNIMSADKRIQNMKKKAAKLHEKR